MPSPFPSMDPYLEGAEWGTFHVELSVEIRRQLSPKVRPKYHVLTMHRFITDVPEAVMVAGRDVYPDAAVVKESPAVWQEDVPAPVQIATVMPSEIPHYIIEIRTAESRELVTTIEVLSPANKCGQGYADYLEKRALILQSDAHLIEIDLLRQGRRVPMQEPLPEAPYYVFLSRAEKRPVLDVWPIQLTASLPSVPVPLLTGDEDVWLDLQLAFDAVYDSVGYRDLLDYRQPPEISLQGEAAEWATSLLADAGFAI